MSLKNILGVAVLSVFTPLAAAAVPLNIDDDITDELRTSYSVDPGNLTLGWEYTETILNSESTGTEKALFTFTNNTGETIRILAGLPATTNPNDPVSAFDPRATFAWGSDAPIQIDGNSIASGVLGLGESIDFSVFFGQAQGVTGFGQADVTFAVQPAAIPVPGALLLLGTALGGIGLARRKRA